MILRLKLYAGVALTFLAALFTFGRAKEKRGERKAQNEFEQDKARREAAGRDEIRKGRDSGLSPADRVRRNDGDWGGV